MDKINLKDLLINDDHIESADITVKSIKTVKLSFSVSEYNSFVNAVDMLTNLSANPKFIASAQEILEYSKSADSIVKTMIDPIQESIFRLPGIKKKAKNTKQRSDSFFTKQYPATVQSIQLYKLSKDYEPKVKYNQDTTTCITDVRVMIGTIVKFVDNPVEVLQDIAPNSSTLYKEITSKSIFVYAKEILDIE